MRAGFPHSEIFGSKLIRSSPKLIAAYYVLHRLCAPRHPLNALKALDRSHYQCPQSRTRAGAKSSDHRRSDQNVGFSRGVACLARGIRAEATSSPSLNDGQDPAGVPRNDRRRRPPNCFFKMRQAGPAVRQVRASIAPGSIVVPLSVAIRARLSWSSRLRKVHRTLSDRRSAPTAIEVVEPDGIEPTTSCLQSRRSPN